MEWGHLYNIYQCFPDRYLNTSELTNAASTRYAAQTKCHVSTPVAASISVWETRLCLCSGVERQTGYSNTDNCPQQVCREEEDKSVPSYLQVKIFQWKCWTVRQLPSYSNCRTAAQWHVHPSLLPK